jgi:hypothetical protein
MGKGIKKYSVQEAIFDVIVSPNILSMNDNLLSKRWGRSPHTIKKLRIEIIGYLKKNAQSIVDNLIMLNSNVQKPNKIKKKQPKNNQKKDFIDEIIDVFKKSYLDAYGIEYEVTNKAVERSCAGKLVKIYREKYPGSESSDTKRNMKTYFDLCCRIQDEWLSNNMGLPIIINKFNQINNILKNGNKRNSNKQGATDGQLAGIVTKHFATRQ